MRRVISHDQSSSVCVWGGWHRYWNLQAPLPPTEAAGRLTLLSQSAPTAQLGYQDFLAAFNCLYEPLFWLGTRPSYAHQLGLYVSLIDNPRQTFPCQNCSSHQKIPTETGTLIVTSSSHFMVTALVVPSDFTLANTFRLIVLIPAISVICHSSHMPRLMMWYGPSWCQPTSDWDTSCIDGTRWAFRRVDGLLRLEWNMLQEK